MRAVTDDPVITSGSTGPGSWSGVGPSRTSRPGAGADDSYFSLARNILKCNTAGNDCPVNLAQRPRGQAYRRASFVQGADPSEWNIMGRLPLLQRAARRQGRNR